MGAIQKKCKAGGDDRLYKGSYIDQRNYCIAKLLETYSEHSWLTLIGMREGTFQFPPLVLSGLYFVSWIFIKIFKTVLEVKIDIIRVNLVSYQAHWVLSKMPLGGKKDDSFFCFHSSCHLGLTLVPTWKGYFLAPWYSISQGKARGNGVKQLGKKG